MKLILPAACLALAMITPGFAQDANKAAHDTVEISGCLSKSGTAFLLAEKSGEKVMVTGTQAQLEPHANHEVKISGERMTKDGKTTVMATKVEMVSAICTTKS